MRKTGYLNNKGGFWFANNQEMVRFRFRLFCSPKYRGFEHEKDEAAIVRSVRHLLLTNYYEKPFHPEIGSNLSRQLFEPMTIQTTLNIKQSIIDAINNYEPRVQINEINVEPRESENGYVISLRFLSLTKK